MDKKRSSIFDGIVYDDLVFVGSAIVGVGRKLLQPDEYVVRKIGREGIKLELDTASVNHCLSPEVYYQELIDAYGLVPGDYDVTKSLDRDARLPDERYIGSIYARLIVDLYEDTQEHILDVFMEVFESEFPKCINDFSYAYYFEQSNILFGQYKNGEFRMDDE